MVLIGLDFSINSSGICVYDDTLEPLEQFRFYNVYRKVTKKKLPLINSLNIEMIKNPTPQVEKDEISKINDAIVTSELIFDILKNADYVGIEGFAFGAKGNRLAE
jgi:hypothetical protein